MVREIVKMENFWEKGKECSKVNNTGNRFNNTGNCVQEITYIFLPYEPTVLPTYSPTNP